MKRITAYEIALSALSCALATIMLTVGTYSELLLFTGYLFGCIALMFPLAKKSYVGYGLAYVATCILTAIFSAARFLDLLPFMLFFGLHPLVNELQLKTKINRWLACLLKTLWFDGVMILLWKFVFGIVSGYPFLDEYIVPIILVVGTAFFLLYDVAMYRWRGWVNALVERITKNK